MAIHFIHAGGYDMGSMMYTSAKDGSEIMVRIEHLTRNGYRLSHGGEIIKEQLSLKPFIERLVRVEDFQQGFSYIENKVQKNMYIVHEALHSRDSGKIRGVGEWLDERYARLIREKKLSLMEHNYSINAHKVGVHTERESISNAERSVTQAEWNIEKRMKYMDEQGYKVQQPMTYDEAYQKGITDDEVYYLTTP